MKRVAIVGSGPSARTFDEGLSEYDRVIGVNEAICYQSGMITDLMIIDERAIPKVVDWLHPEVRLILSLQAMSHLLSAQCKGDVASRFFEHPIEVRRACTSPQHPGHILAGPAGTIVSALWYANVDLEAASADVFGCDFHEPGAPRDRNELLRSMAILLDGVVDSGAFDPMEIEFVGRTSGEVPV